MIICNARTLDNPMTGVPRYILELTARFGSRVRMVKPDTHLFGVKGHLWEQLALPFRIGNDLLWSPGITGPLAIEKQVVTIHDVVPLDHPEWLSPKFAAWYRFLTPRLVRRVRHIIVDSEFTRQRLVAHCPEASEKATVVHLAADRRFTPASAESVRETTKKLAIPSPNYLVALGSLEPRKNLHRLLQAWEQIEGRLPQDVWLVVAGAEGRKLVFGDVSFEKLPPRVHLTGRVADELLPALYSGAIASVYVSLYEGFGFPPLEAMACGTPVLTSDVASLPEVVGDAASLIDPLDVESIAQGLVALVENAGFRAKLKTAGLTQAGKFSWDKSASETWEILQQANY